MGKWIALIKEPEIIAIVLIIALELWLLPGILNSRADHSLIYAIGGAAVVSAFAVCLSLLSVYRERKIYKGLLQDLKKILTEKGKE